VKAWGNTEITKYASEEDLIAGLRRGDEKAAEILVRKNGPWMLSLARRMLKDDAMAADSVQEAFISAFANIGKFESRSTLKTWLHRIVVNKCLMLMRSQKQKAEESLDKWMPSFDSNNCRVEPPWTRLLSTDEICESRQLSAAVHTAIQGLPENFRIVLHLRDIEGFSTAEVAEILGLSETNVKVRLHRGRSALKLILEPVLRGHIS
jgi:RNA polymerase sigma-70 factor (ECF subfamily)